MVIRMALDGLALGSVLLGRGLVSLGWRPVPSGWRNVVGVGLRFEASKFAVTAFGLKVPSANPAADLQRFLDDEPHAQFRLDHEPWRTIRVPTSHADVVELQFAEDGSLTGLDPWLSPREPILLDPAARAMARSAILSAYNATRTLPESIRPQRLLAALSLPDPGAQYARRLLAATSLVHESTTDRFSPPEFRHRRGLGFGFLTVTLRPGDGSTTDAWLLAHHTGADGVPLQELATRLDQAWGSEPVCYPEAGTVIGPRLVSGPGERDVYESLAFLDFTPLLSWRKATNRQLPHETTVGALLAWQLSQEPEFADTKYACTVDVAADADQERDVDLVVVHPAEPARTLEGLAEFSRRFNEQVAACRNRTSATRAAVRDAEHLPSWLHRQALERNPNRVRETFGSVGLSILREAQVFVAPFADVGYPGGFLAVGRLNLPTAQGLRVGAVSIKGTREQAGHYPVVLQRMLDRCGSESASQPTPHESRSMRTQGDAGCPYPSRVGS